jgi:hypothetical protein
MSITVIWSLAQPNAIAAQVVLADRGLGVVDDLFESGLV